MTECDHSDLAREEIPEFSLYEYWVCSCGEVIELCEDSPYPRKSDLKALLPSPVTKGKNNGIRKSR